LSVGGQFVTLHDEVVFLVTVSGERAGVLRSQVNAQLAPLSQPVPAPEFAFARAAFEYHVFAETQTPSALAASVGWFAAEGNPAYAPGLPSGQYLRTIETLDAQAVARAVRAYLQRPFEVRVSAPGQTGAG